MRKDAWLFAGPLLILSAMGMLLRSLELRGSLDRSAMTMTFGAPSGLLIGVTVLAALFVLVLCLRMSGERSGGAYGQIFRGSVMPMVSGAALLLCLGGALLCLRQDGLSSLLVALLALLGVLAGAGWFSLSLDAVRGKPGTYTAALPTVLFACLFLIFYYKSFAQLPALLYTMYPFLALCAALCGLHLISGWTVGKRRKRGALFCAGLGTYLCAVAAVGGDHPAFRLFFAALALELFAHGICLITAPFIPAEEAPAEGAEEAEEAPAAEAEAADASESADPEAPAGEGKTEK